MTRDSFVKIGFTSHLHFGKYDLFPRSYNLTLDLPYQRLYDYHEIGNEKDRWDMEPWREMEYRRCIK
jgi:hypothetical protein